LEFEVEVGLTRSVSQIVERIEELKRDMHPQDLEYVSQLISHIVTDQTDFAKVDMYELFAKEVNQQMFINKLYLYKIQKDTTTVRLADEKFEMVLIAFKCILQSNPSILFQTSRNLSRT
jgi:hypothetical protein